MTGAVARRDVVLVPVHWRVERCWIRGGEWADVEGLPMEKCRLFRRWGNDEIGVPSYGRLTTPTTELGRGRCWAVDVCRGGLAMRGEGKERSGASSGLTPLVTGHERSKI